jgi:phosphatidylglycerol:prolipoprotein diacylglycerol transferase
MMAIAFMVGLIFIVLEAKRKSISLSKVIFLALLIYILGWMGGRIGHYLLYNPRKIIEQPLELLRFWKGGLAAYGGIVFGFLSSIFLLRLFKLPFWSTLDLVAPSLAIGNAIGRIGCFLNGCCYGKPTKVFWAVVYTNPDAIAPIMQPLHPTQLYESVASLFLFFFLWKMRKKYKISGYLFLSFIIGYSLIRSVVVFYRWESRPLLGNYFYFTHLLSLLAILFSLSIMICLRKGTR